ncbi:hypothetical protein BA6E_103158 [Bacteroidales bacterium 6E]|nr:hypothetical protein BA6E_103158 [Bacteroidales bacterium 6E]
MIMITLWALFSYARLRSMTFILQSTKTTKSLKYEKDDLFSVCPVVTYL